MIRPSKRLGEVKEYYFSTKLREIASLNAQGKDIINLGIGSPDIPPPQEVIEELRLAASQPGNHAYQSYKGLPELRSAFAEWYHTWFDVELDADSEVLPLIGSKEGIMHISMSFLDAGDEVLVPNPGYPAYSAVTRLAGAVVRNYDLTADRNWLPDLDALEKENLTKVKIMWVNYPHMPTGSRADNHFFKRLVAFGQKHSILICNDNPYAFILHPERCSILSIPGAKETALELNSLSKAQNMAGWRVGMVAGKEEYINTILRFKSNMDSGMFKPVQLAAVKALRLGSEWYDSLNQTYRDRRKIVYRILDVLNCEYDPSHGGLFVWASIPEGIQDGFELADRVLYDANVFITPGGIFGSNGTSYIRISLCNTLDILESALRRIENADIFSTSNQKV